MLSERHTTISVSSGDSKEMLRKNKFPVMLVAGDVHGDQTLRICLLRQKVEDSQKQSRLALWGAHSINWGC